MKKWIGIILALALILPCFGASAADVRPVLRGRQVVELYSFDYANRAYHRVTETADITSLNNTLAALPISKGAEKTTVSDGARGFLAFLNDGTRLAWYVTSAQLSDDIGVIPASQLVRDKLLNLAGKYNAKYPGSAQSLAFIDKSKVAWISYHDMGDWPDSGKTMYYEGNDPYVRGALIDGLKALSVKPQPTIWRHKPGETIYRPAIGYSWTITIRMDSGAFYELHPGDTNLDIWSANEDLLYEVDKSEFEVLRQTMAQHKPTQLYARFYDRRNNQVSCWSTTYESTAVKIRELTLQKASRTYTQQEYEKFEPALEQKMIGRNLYFYSIQEADGIVFLPLNGAGKGFFWSNVMDRGAWYLTEEATKELSWLLQPSALIKI